MPTKMKTDKMAETLTPIVTRVANGELTSRVEAS